MSATPCHNRAMTNATAKATIHTNYGDIVVELFGNHAPLTVENFIGLADGSRQWKHPRTGEIMNTPLYKDEIHPELSFSKPYLLAMANAGPGTNGSQFFITTVETPWLNGRHTIFGEVTDEASKKVVDAIEGVETGFQDRPVKDVVISSIDIEKL